METGIMEFIDGQGLSILRAVEFLLKFCYTGYQ